MSRRSTLIVSVVYSGLLVCTSVVSGGTEVQGASSAAPPSSTTPAPSEPASTAAAKSAYTCEVSTRLPFDLASQDQVGADDFAWQTFLALNAATSSPQWTTWRPTVDLIDCNQSDPPADGTCQYGWFYPKPCQDIEGYASFKVLDQVGKVDDTVLEADVKGLSSSPVVTSRGTFLRYQILLSPQTASWLVGQELQKESELQDMQKAMTPVAFLCSDSQVPGSNGQSTVVKLAWMEAGAADADAYYTQDMLVYTPAWRSSTGEATCTKNTMALVGMHVARKTVSQPAWVWATFEHRNNAPDCGSLPGKGDTEGDGGPSTDCPATASQDWSFYAASCQKDGQSGACQSCNTPPAPNGVGKSCVNPQAQEAYDSAQKTYLSDHQAWLAAGSKGSAPKAPDPPASWCLDLPPAQASGMSRLCRQVAPGDYYPGAKSWDDTPPNKACQPKGTVWANYQLISTQWNNTDLGQSGTCPNVQDQLWRDVPDKTWPVVDHTLIEPRLAGFLGKEGKVRSLLANTSMESYERSNCMGCHTKTTIEESMDGATAHLPNSAYGPKSPGTDFMYFLGLQVPGFEPARSSTETSTAGAPKTSSGTRR